MLYCFRRLGLGSLSRPIRRLCLLFLSPPLTVKRVKVSYLFFMDESGHDHGAMPYEVRGGIVLHASKVWPFINSLQRLERRPFGGILHEYGSELKGERLLKTKAVRLAAQEPTLSEAERQESARLFLAKTARSQPPTRREFTAYGQACAHMVSGFFDILARHGARVFASMVPRGGNKGAGKDDLDKVRKDQQHLMERYFYFLEEKDETGLLVLDETDRTDDRRYLRRMERYFARSGKGRRWARRIVPAPMFIASDMSYAVQAADIAIYCVNWGFRASERGIDAEVRQQVADVSADALKRLQFRISQWRQDGTQFESFSIFCVPELYK